jgi:hypothetical protein
MVKPIPQDMIIAPVSVLISTVTIPWNLGGQLVICQIAESIDSASVPIRV